MTKEKRPGNNRRKLEFDFIKGVMIILVVFGHSGTAAMRQGVMGRIVDFVYLFHMPVFLLISGYLFVPRSKVATDLLSIARTILVPYCLFALVYTLLHRVLHFLGYQTSTQLSVGFFQQMVVCPVAFWYLHNLAMFRMVLVLACLVTRRTGISPLITLVTSLLLIIWSPVALRLDSFLFLLLGFVLRHLNWEIVQESSFNLLIVFLLVLLLRIDVPCLEKTLLAMCIISVLSHIYFKLPYTVGVRVVSYIGRNSLVIYLIHVFAVYGIKLFASRLVAMDPTYIVYLILSCVLSIALALFVARVCDFVKVSSILFGKEKIYSPWGGSISMNSTQTT